MPQVSVILTSYNHGNFISEAIESVLNQTFQDFELIIWDDASVDNSWGIIKSYNDPRIQAFRNPQNKGPVFGVNKSIFEVASGKYIAIHHSDDVWELNKLQKQVGFLEANQTIGAVFSNAQPIDERSLPLADPNHFYFNIFNQLNRSRHEWLRNFFLNGNALCHPSILIRKRCYVDCGTYRDILAQLPDFDMWIRLCLKYEIHVLPEKLVRFRVLDNEANSSGSRPETRIRSAYELYKLQDNFKEIASFEDLIKIFPIAEEYYRNEETDLCFVLAMVALEIKQFPLTQLFSQNLLFEAISDPMRSANIKRLYGFDYQSFIALTAKYDVFSLEENQLLVTQRDETQSQNRQLFEESQLLVTQRDETQSQNRQLFEENQLLVTQRDETQSQNRQLFEESQLLVTQRDETQSLNVRLFEENKALAEQLDTGMLGFVSRIGIRNEQ